MVGNGGCAPPFDASDDVDVQAASASRLSPSSATRRAIVDDFDVTLHSLANRRPLVASHRGDPRHTDARLTRPIPLRVEPLDAAGEGFVRPEHLLQPL